MTIRTRPPKNAPDWYDYGGDLDAASRTVDAVGGPLAAAVHTHTASQVTDATTVGRSLLTAVDAAAGRTAIGAGTSSFSGAYSALTGAPTIPSTPGAVGAAPAVHTHVATDITNATTLGRSVLTAADAAAGRAAVGAAATVHGHVAAELSDATTLGRSVLTAADAATARTALGIAGTGQVALTLTQAQYDALATKDPNTLYRVAG